MKKGILMKGGFQERKGFYGRNVCKLGRQKKLWDYKIKPTYSMESGADGL